MDKTDLLLIDPPWIIEDNKNLWKNIGSRLPSLGIAYIASMIETEGASVRILDCTAEEIALTKIEDRLKTFSSPKFVGITATTPLIINAYKIAGIVKKLFPSTKVVLGGVHPSVLPDESLNNPDVDFVVRDEGEITVKELLSGVPIEKIEGLSWKMNGKMLHNPIRPLIKNLDEIPLPAYHLLPMKKYYPAVGSYKRLPAISIFATRGCPGRCTFCYRTFYGKVRARSADNILNEIKILQRDYGIKEIAFYDDTFTLFKNVVSEFCQKILEQKIDIVWSCFTRVDYVNEEILKAMKKAGCHLILFGVESADENILKNINKRISLEQVREVVEICRKIGIETRASFMIGNSGETEETIKKTIDFAIDLDPDEVQFNITTAYPGTELFKWADEMGYILDKDWSNYNMSYLNLHLPTVSQERLRYYYKLSHTRFYIRPKIIARRLFRIRTIPQLKQEINGFFGIIKTFL